MKTIYIKDIEKTLLISSETFLLTKVERLQDKNNKDYFNLELADKTGKISAKIWNDKISFIDSKSLKVGKIVKIDAKTEEFKGILQLNIQSLSGVDETKLDDYLETSMFDSEEMYKELLAIVDSFSDKNLKNVVLEILNDKDVKKRLMYWPAANTVHHVFRSGLLQHILEMLTIAKGLERFYPDANFDILNTGIVLHDIGKIYELDGSDLAIPYTKEGLLLGHIYLGAKLFEEFAGDKLDDNTKLHITHLILSHHGTHEFGAPVVPATTEAIMLHYIDNVSAKARTADSVKNDIKDADGFSNRVMWLENTRIWNFKKGKNSNKDVAADDSENSTEEGDQITLLGD